MEANEKGREGAVQRTLRRIPAPKLPHLTLKQVRLLRLFGLLAVFSCLTLYAVFRSERFQEVLRKKSQRTLEALTGRKVQIGRFDLALVPPAFLVHDVSISNDPEGLPQPAFSAAQIELRGIPRISEDEIDLPKLRIRAPRIVFEVFPDGRTNFSSILERLPKKNEKSGGADLRLRELVLQNGVFRFREFRARLDLEMRNVAATANSPAFSARTKGSFLCRHLRLKIGDHDILEFGVGLDVLIAPGRLALKRVAIRAPDLGLEAIGGIEDLSRPELKLAFGAAFTAEALDRYFGAGLPVDGLIRAQGTFRLPFGRPYEVLAGFEVPDAMLGPFPMKGSGHVRIRPDGVLVRVDRAEYAGGVLHSTIRVARLNKPPLPIRFTVSGEGIDFERFFADLGLAGTGLMAQGNLEAVLSFEKGGIENADGVARLELSPDLSRRSAVAGRHAIPLGGGGPLLVRAGRIVFPSLPMQTQAGLQLTIDGTLPFSNWAPSLDLVIDAPDLKEAERLAENWYPAIQKRPLAPPLFLGGSGRLVGRIERSFGDPLVTGSLSAKNFVLRKVRFGDASARFTVDRNVLTLEPFESQDDGGTLQLTGKVGWGGALADEYRLEDLSLVTSRWPVERILQFLTFDLPIEGKVSGTLPLGGVTPAVHGAGNLTFETASLWGQPFDTIRGVLGFEGTRMRFSDVEASLGGGSVRGAGVYRYDGGYEFNSEMCHFPAHHLALLARSISGLEAYGDGKVAGEGTLEKPGLSLDLTFEKPTYDGTGLTRVAQPARLTFELDPRSGARGNLSAPGLYAFTLSRTGGAPASVPYRLEGRIDSLGSFKRLFGLTDPAMRFDGSVSGHADIFVPEAAEEDSWLTGSLDAGRVVIAGRAVELVKPASFDWRDSVLKIAEVRMADRGQGARPGFVPVQASLSGTVATDGEGPIDLDLKADFDAAYLQVVAPDVSIAGPVGLNLAVGGTTTRPEVEGRVYLKGLEYSAGPGATPVKAITGTLLFQPGRLSTEDLELYYDGAVRLSGSMGLLGLVPSTIRINANISRMKAQPFSGFHCVVSGDLALLGEEGALRSARGDLKIDSGLYDEDLDLSLQRVFSAFGPSGLTSRTPTRFDSIDLDIRIAVPASVIEVRNNVARFRASGDLTARGTFGRPLLFGQVEAEEGGKLLLRGLRYDLVSAKLLFSNPYKIDPNFELEARTQVGSYQLTLGLTGTLNRFTPRFLSDPPMSEAQVVSTMMTGKPPDSASYVPPGGASPVSSDESIATAARNLIAGLATDVAATRTKELFKLDRLQIDPVFAGSTFEATRLTVAKTIAKDLTVTYSFKSSTNAEQIILLEYQVSRDAFLQFIRDEAGIYSGELKIRQRLK